MLNLPLKGVLLCLRSPLFLLPLLPLLPMLPLLLLLLLLRETRVWTRRDIPWHNVSNCPISLIDKDARGPYRPHNSPTAHAKALHAITHSRSGPGHGGGPQPGCRRAGRGKDPWPKKNELAQGSAQLSSASKKRTKRSVAEKEKESSSWAVKISKSVK